MASYLTGSQGVDYIPKIQSFNPDFNFYQSALQTKQAQYQQGYNKISGLYSSILNSPMLRDDNNDRRDAFFKKVNESIQKISGMDLSLEENVNSAYKVFDPIIQDKGLHKDIAFTKQYNGELQRGEAYRNNAGQLDAKGHLLNTGSYDPEAIKALHYQADDFRKADADTALSIANPHFTPYVDNNRLLSDEMVASGMKCTRQSLDGQWIVTDTNGVAVVPRMADYFMHSLQSNPLAKDMFNTQAYVHRKDFIAQNADKYGSEDGAENAHNNIIQTSLSEQSRLAQIKGNRDITSLTQRMSIVQGKLERGEVLDPKKATNEVESYADQLARATAALDIHKSTSDLTNRSNNLGASKFALRDHFDKAVAYDLMGQTSSNTAYDYAMLHGEHKMEANPFSMEHQKHLDTLDEIRTREDYA